jgi:hypothetical protein
VQEPDVSAGSIHKYLKDSIQHFGLSCDNLSSFSADNANVNFGRKKSVYQHLLNHNDTIGKANCTAHIIHNCCKHASKFLDIDIKTIILRTYSHFSSSGKRRKALSSFFKFVNCDYSELLRHVPTR